MILTKNDEGFDQVVVSPLADDQSLDSTSAHEAMTYRIDVKKGTVAKSAPIAKSGRNQERAVPASEVVALGAYLDDGCGEKARSHGFSVVPIQTGGTYDQVVVSPLVNASDHQLGSMPGYETVTYRIEAKSGKVVRKTIAT